MVFVTEHIFYEKNVHFLVHLRKDFQAIHCIFKLQLEQLSSTLEQINTDIE